MPPPSRFASYRARLACRGRGEKSLSVREVAVGRVCSGCAVARQTDENLSVNMERAVSFRLAGYFPKKIEPRDVRLKAPAVREIWSVSECISKGPKGWIDKWRHNALWLFDTPEVAESVVPEGERPDFRIVGYRVWPCCFEAGEERDLPAFDGETVLLDPAFVSRGFDAVVRGLNGFQCSPLSCNYAAATMENERILSFSSLGFGPCWGKGVLFRELGAGELLGCGGDEPREGLGVLARLV